MTILQQLLPLLRLDGYYVVSDLTGVPDILSRLRPILRSLIPGRPPEPAVEALKPWARAAVSAYVIALVPVFALLLVLLVISAPRLFATAWDSLGLQSGRIRDAVDDGELARGGRRRAAAGRARPAVRGHRLLVHAARRAAGARRGRLGARRRAAHAWSRRGAALALAGLAVFTWWPNGDYEPLRRGERVTLASAVDALRAIPSGRPSFTPAREDRVRRRADRARARRAGSRRARARAAGGARGRGPTPPAEPEPGVEPESTRGARLHAHGTPAPAATPPPRLPRRSPDAGSARHALSRPRRRPSRHRTPHRATPTRGPATAPTPTPRRRRPRPPRRPRPDPDADCDAHSGSVALAASADEDRADGANFVRMASVSDANHTGCGRRICLEADVGRRAGR